MEFKNLLSQSRVLVFLVITLSFVLSACGGKSHSPTLVQTDPPDDNKSGTMAKVCYPSGLCVNSAFLNSAPDFAKNYKYPDPKDGLSADWQDQYSAPQYSLKIDENKLDQKISDNFWLRDFIIYNNATKTFEYAVVMRTLIEKVQAIRDSLKSPIYVTSAFRTPGYNSTLKGAAKFSRHIYGDGVDIVSPGASAGELKRLCDEQGAYYSYAYADGHAHCDWRHMQLDSAFYPGAILPRIERIDPYFITGGRIQVDSHGKSFHLSLKDFMTFEDNEGEHIYDWTIHTPSGETLHFDSEKVILKKQSGTYYISLIMGESVLFEKTVQW